MGLVPHYRPDFLGSFYCPCGVFDVLQRVLPHKAQTADELCMSPAARRGPPCPSLYFP